MAFSVIYPTKSHQINSHYGQRGDSFHSGTDLKAALGDPIYAAATGTVIRARFDNSWGNYVKIDHGVIDGTHYYTLYAHNSELLVTTGQKVVQGQQIAKAGSTGNSTGPHCHFEIYRGREATSYRVNPEPYLPEGGAYVDAASSSPAYTYTITYQKWSGYGVINENFVPLLWYEGSGNPTPYGFGNLSKRIYYGMNGETMRFLGKIDNYYYGYVYGLCKSRILCVVPVNKVRNVTGAASGSTGVIYINEASLNDTTYSNSFNGKKYALSATELKHIANLCQQEQGSTKGAAAEASLMANRYEASNSSKSLYSYIRTSGWWSKAASHMDNGSSSQAVVNAVQDVLVNGNRTLPKNVDEHDCFEDLASVNGRSTGLTKAMSFSTRVSNCPAWVRDRSLYISGQTVITNIYGSKYTF